MFKIVALPIAATLVAAATFMMPATAGATALGPHAATCDTGGPAVLVHVDGFRTRTGSLRVQLYTNDPATYLEKGKYLERVEVPVTASGAMNVCLPVPRPGIYAVSVRHDANGDQKSNKSDGGGFSGNPSLSITDLAFKRKPALSKTQFPVGATTRQVDVILNYVQGLSFKPLKG